jgi:hypothetical protein
MVDGSAQMLDSTTQQLVQKDGKWVVARIPAKPTP